MVSSVVELVEPFRSAIEENRPHDVCQQECRTSEELWGRAMARAALGLDEEARLDYRSILDSCASDSQLADACRLELAFLDQRANRDVDAALEVLEKIKASAQPGTSLGARTSQVTGLAQMKQGRYVTALDALLSAADLFGNLQDLDGRAQVFDSLGMLQADAGQVEDAVHYFALSLVDKTLEDDRLGVAITLGNLGRLHLTAGRITEAIACFQRDLAIAQSMKHDRGVARMYEDLGRAKLASGDLAEAEKLLRQSLAAATERHYHDLEFYARKDLALTFCAAGRLDEAHRELAAAAQTIDPGNEYFQALLTSAEGQLLAARGDHGAIAKLQQAVESFSHQQLPEWEIGSRIALTKALATSGSPEPAGACVLRALALAQQRGMRRYLPVLNELMASLNLVEGITTEGFRPIATSPGTLNENYVLISSLGGGSFGEVFRVFDPQHGGRQVAVKRLLLRGIYRPQVRQSLVHSARVELEVASRVRHPGIARVYSIGTEPDGNTYIVQEFVDGPSLRQVMNDEKKPDSKRVLQVVRDIAYALAALHEAGVCHRDLKPENVIVRDGGSAVLIDFGVAHFMDSGDDNIFAGTLVYCAPEQLASDAIDGRADLYALGVLAFEWLCGFTPLNPIGKTLAEKARFVARQPCPSICDFRSDVDAEVEKLVLDLLAKKPKHRPATAGELAQRLDALLDGA